ncbi:MAG: hypothetical protein AAGE01_02665 [Pseudomonadota bacterium]
MELKVAFDTHQVGRRLVWVFDENGKSALAMGGINSGSIYLAHGATFGIRILGIGRENHLKHFEIADCSLVTLPHRSSPHESKASPFSDTCATHLFSDWSQAENVQVPGAFHHHPHHGQLDGPEHTKAYEVFSTDSLTVIHETGLWDLSLTVTILMIGSEGDVVRRVFFFDPEAQVGTGTDPG